VVRSSPIPVAIVLAVLIVSGAGLIRLQEGSGPQPSASTGQAGPAEDDPNGFGDFLSGSAAGDSDTTASYLEAERLLRERLAKQAKLEAGGDSRAIVLRGLGAVAQPWTWLGPRNWGGRTRAFVVSPSNPKVMFAGGITGGLWRSDDAGASWSPLIDTFSNISIGVIEIDPTNPQVMYAGTGEAYYRPWPANRGNGIMKSIDGGISWAFLDATTKNDAFDWVGDIEVSPHDSKRVYAATGTGVWVSTDAGESWGSEPVLKSTQGADGLGCPELAIRSDVVPDVIFASCGDERVQQGVYRSTNAGTDWEQVLPADGTKIGFAALAIAPSNQDTIYASVSGTDLHAKGLYASTSGGAPGSWAVRASPGPTSGQDWLSHCEHDPGEDPGGNPQGGYDNDIAVDPTDPNRLWVGGIDLWRSEDGGKTFTVASNWALAPADGTSYVHADQHAIVFDPAYDGSTDRKVYFASDGGLYRTNDDRADLAGTSCGAIKGITYESLNHGYGVAQFTGGSVSDDGRIVIGGTQDNGTFRLDAASASDWVSIWGGDGGNTAIHGAGDWLIVTNPSLVDRKKRTARLQFARLTGTARNGENATCKNYYSDECSNIGLNQEEDSIFYPPLERDVNDASVLYTGGTKVWRTTDIGSSWAAVGTLPSGTVSAIGLAPNDPNTVYAGTYGHVYRSSNATDAAATWTPLDAGFPSAEVTSIAVDPTDASTVFVSFDTFDGAQVWRSVSGGPFEAVDGPLPEVPVHTLAINPRNHAMVYAGTDVGVFESLDGGTGWRVANENLATTIINRLLFRTGTSELYAFTFGRGAYKVDVGDKSPPANDEISAAKEVVLAPDYRDIVDIRSGSSGSDDPELSCGSSLLPTQTRSVWYRLISSDGGHYSVSTEGSNFDTVLAILTPAGGTKLSEVACNDDSAKAQGPSALAFDATAGRTYYIEVTRSASSAANTLANTLQLVVTR
jgi:hypothetical protein